MAVRAFVLAGLLHLIAVAACAQPAQPSGEMPLSGPVLRVETGMHGAIINRLALVDQGRTLLTVSDDKTVRTWSLPGGAPQTIRRTPIGAADDGALFAVAVNGDTVVVGGRTVDRRSKTNALYVFDRRTGAMRGTVGGFINPITSLAFSKDGHYLAVGEQGPRGLTVIDFRERKLALYDNDYGDTIRWLDFASDGRLAVSSADGKIRVYDSALKRIALATVPGQSGASVKIWGVAFSPDGSRLAVGDATDAHIEILKSDTLAPLQRLDGAVGRTGALSVVGWNANGSRVAAAGGYKDATGRHFLRAWSVGGTGPPIGQEVAVARDLVTDLAYRPDGTIVYTNAEPAIGLTGAAGGAVDLQGPRQSDFRDAGEAFQVSADGAVIEFSTRQGGKAPFRFDFLNGILTANPPPRADLRRPALTDPRLTGTGWRIGEKPTFNGHPIVLAAGDVVRSMAILPNGDGAAIGTEYYLRVERAAGAAWQKIVPAPAWAVNTSGDGRYVIAALGDGTIRWFASSDGAETMALFVDARDGRWVTWIPEGFFDHSQDRKSGGGESLIGYHLDNGPGKFADFVDDAQLYQLFYRRDLVLDKFRNLQASARIVATQLARIGNVRDVLKTGLPPKLALVDACILPSNTQTCGSGTAVPPNQSTESARVVTGEGGLMLVRYRVEARDGTPGHVVIRRDGAVIAGLTTVESADGGQRVERVVLPVSRAGDEFHFATLTDKAAIQSRAEDDVVVRVKPSPVPPKTADDSSDPSDPQLFGVAIGVSHYQVTDFALENAANDAAAVAKLIGQPSPPVYGIAHVQVLTDQDATAAKITAALEAVAAKARPQDIVMIFFSGHGEAVDGKYYFAPVDFAAKSPDRVAELKTADDARAGQIVDELFRKDGYGEEQLLPLLARIQGNLLLVLDTCFSATLASSDAIGRQARNQTVTNSFGRETGRFILAGARSLAADSNGADKQDEAGRHGLFTTILLKGLAGEGDLEHSGRIEVDDLLKFTKTRVLAESRRLHLDQEPYYYFAGSNFFDLRAVKLEK